MKKTKKRKPGIPPLSFLDKCIYGLAFLLIILIAGCFILFHSKIALLIAKSNPATVAFSSHPTNFFILPAFCYVFISALVFTLCKRIEKKPIFGNGKITYGQEPWNKNYYPLFSPERKNRYVRPSHKKFQRKCIIVWLVGLVITLLLFPFGLFGRTCLLQNNSIVEYNMFNNAVMEYTTENFEELTLQTNYVTLYRGGSYWEYVMTIEMDNGKKFSFSNGDFITDSNEDKLEKMMEIKSFFPNDRITIKGESNVDKVADVIGLSDSEAELLHKLISSD